MMFLWGVLLVAAGWGLCEAYHFIMAESRFEPKEMLCPTCMEGAVEFIGTEEVQCRLCGDVSSMYEAARARLEADAVRT